MEYPAQNQRKIGLLAARLAITQAHGKDFAPDTSPPTYKVEPNKIKLLLTTTCAGLPM